MSNNEGPKPAPAPKEKPEEQACQLDIAVQSNKVVIQFARPVNQIVLSPDQAAGMGQALFQCAKVASGKKLIVVPG